MQITTVVVWAPDEHAKEELSSQVQSAILLLQTAMRSGKVVPAAGCIEALMAQQLLRLQLSSSGSGRRRPTFSMLRHATMNFVESLQDCVVALRGEGLAAYSQQVAADISNAASISGPEASETKDVTPAVLPSLHPHFQALLDTNAHLAKPVGEQDSAAIRTREAAPRFGWLHGSTISSSPQVVSQMSKLDGKMFAMQSGESGPLLELASVKKKALTAAVEAACVILRIDGVVKDTRT